ncbi:MAG: hypothetical protein CTY20_08020 [Hyphomicrobium sp.]|nr:MAG: hypothetical protein CTY20_08020 [Hyphomicrobium sp.]
MNRLAQLLFAVASVATLAAAVPLVMAASNESRANCFSDDGERRISGCTDVLATPDLAPDEAAVAYAMRALAYSLKGSYAEALLDYDEAIRRNPDFSIALNNRAWALFRSGRAGEGLADVERALGLSPGSPHALDTRAHIRQEMGETQLAIADYELAMRFGGERMIKLYQCGLQANGLYNGDLNGLYTQSLRRALETCVSTRGCDPLPPDEECRKVTS